MDSKKKTPNDEDLNSGKDLDIKSSRVGDEGLKEPEKDEDESPKANLAKGGSDEERGSRKLGTSRQPNEEENEEISKPAKDIVEKENQHREEEDEDLEKPRLKVSQDEDQDQDEDDEHLNTPRSRFEDVEQEATSAESSGPASTGDSEASEPEEDKNNKEKSDEGMEGRKEHSFDDLANEKIDTDQEKTKTYANNDFRKINSFASQISSSSLYSNSKQQEGSKWHLLVLTVIGLVVIGATVFLLKQTFSTKSSASPTPSSTSAPVQSLTPTPTSTPSPISRGDYKIRILNGTEKSGLAGGVAAKLKDLGYVIDKTGNATNSAYTKTVIMVKERKKGMIDQLIKDLASDFVASVGGSLKDSDSADAEIILGAK